jgi:type VI secretion system protein VasJ
MPDTEQLARIATQPIPGDSPTGESIRYDEAFAVLEAEVGKLENPAGGEVDWRAVQDGAAGLLESRSKDLLLAAWLARALWQREGLTGLAAGLGCLRGLLATFWDGMHPQRVRPRRAALEWLGEKLAATLTDDAIASEPASVAECVRELEQIVAWSEGRFDGEDCGLLGLLSRLRSGAPAPAADAPAEAADQGGGSSPSVSGGPAGPIASRAQAVARLRELAEWWARHEPSSPMVPLLNRAVTWSDLDFPTLFALLLKNRSDAKDYMWDVLGLNDQQQG